MELNYKTVVVPRDEVGTKATWVDMVKNRKRGLILCTLEPSLVLSLKLKIE